MIHGVLFPILNPTIHYTSLHYLPYIPTILLIQGALDSTGGVLSTLKYIVTESTTTITSAVASTVTGSDGTSGSGGGGSVMSLFNYGLLTAVHVVPGFLSFVAMR